MRLIDLILKENQTSLKRLTLMAGIAGSSNAAILAVINNAAQHIKDPQTQLSNIALFFLFLLAYAYAQRYVLITTAEEVEQLVHRYRKNLVNRLKMCELKEVEHIGRGRIFSAIGTDTQTISQSASGLVLAIQSFILIICTSAYLAWLSLTILLIVGAFLLIATHMYVRKMNSVDGELNSATLEENRLHDQVNELLDGFKEVKLSSKRALGVLDDVVQMSERTANFRTEAQRAMSANFIFAQLAFFLLLGTLVFFIPMVSASYSDTIMKSMTTVMFMIGPISSIIATLPQITIANVAAENLHKLHQLLEGSILEANGQALAESLKAPPLAFKTIELRQTSFSHSIDENNFSVGPINLVLRAGETVFITGGNGSGKSTLIKLMTGLYPPSSGELLINGIPVTSANAQVFRDNFCAVFADFHLFHKLYGIEPPDPQLATSWLEEMEVADKTQIRRDRFTQTDLSSGQKKRLALISALLEDKPVLILDEWAADQDPIFRRKFYEELLPRLKAEGKTIIAVTHDDRYFHIADRRLQMEEGKLSELTEHKKHG